MALKELLIKDTLGNHAANELKVIQVVLVDHARAVVWEVTDSIVCSREESPILVEHLSGKFSVEFSCHSASIDTWL